MKEVLISKFSIIWTFRKSFFTRKKPYKVFKNSINSTGNTQDIFKDSETFINFHQKFLLKQFLISHFKTKKDQETSTASQSVPQNSIDNRNMMKKLENKTRGIAFSSCIFHKTDKLTNIVLHSTINKREKKSLTKKNTKQCSFQCIF